MNLARPLWLASRSPRRRLMLQEAGIEAIVQPSDIDDSHLRRNDVTPEQWVTALAYLKARRVADTLRGWQERYAMWWWPHAAAAESAAASGTVLGADTVCVVDQSIFGQPRDAAEARRMLRAIRNAEHRTITGLCLFQVSDGARMLLCDRTVVRVGHVSDSQIEHYINSGDWRGKAGAYNLSERLAAGWPIQWRGDPATVMGLPMQRLKGLLARVN